MCEKRQNHPPCVIKCRKLPTHPACIMIIANTVIQKLYIENSQKKRGGYRIRPRCFSFVCKAAKAARSLLFATAVYLDVLRAYVACLIRSEEEYKIGVFSVGAGATYKREV